MAKWSFSKKQKYFIGLILLLVALRAVAPEIILWQLNKKFAKFSNIYALHIDDFDFAFFRGAYLFEGVKAWEKTQNKTFFTSPKIDISLAWRELLRGRMLCDVVIEQPKIDLDQSLATFALQNAEQSKAAAIETKETVLPLNVELVAVKNGNVNFRQMANFKLAAPWQLKKLFATVTNITSTEKKPLSDFSVEGQLMGSAPLKAKGQFNLQREPSEWRVTTELKQFNLPEANSILRTIAPLSFNRGELDLYAEVRSREGTLLGYVRPFITDLDLIGDKIDFKGARHFIYEILGAVVNFILEDKNENIATQVDFGTVNGKIEVNTAKAIRAAINHGLTDEKVPPRNENSLPISPKAN